MPRGWPEHLCGGGASSGPGGRRLSKIHVRQCQGLQPLTSRAHRDVAEASARRDVYAEMRERADRLLVAGSGKNARLRAEILGLVARLRERFPVFAGLSRERVEFRSGSLQRLQVRPQSAVPRRERLYPSAYLSGHIRVIRCAAIDVVHGVPRSSRRGRVQQRCPFPPTNHARGRSRKSFSTDPEDRGWPGAAFSCFGVGPWSAARVVRSPGRDRRRAAVACKAASADGFGGTIRQDPLPRGSRLSGAADAGNGRTDSCSVCEGLRDVWLQSRAPVAGADRISARTTTLPNTAAHGRKRPESERCIVRFSSWVCPAQARRRSQTW